MQIWRHVFFPLSASTHSVIMVMNTDSRQIDMVANKPSEDQDDGVEKTTAASLPLVAVALLAAAVMAFLAGRGSRNCFFTSENASTRLQFLMVKLAAPP
jgi:hypothetical protein